MNDPQIADSATCSEKILCGPFTITTTDGHVIQASLAPYSRSWSPLSGKYVFWEKPLWEIRVWSRINGYAYTGSFIRFGQLDAMIGCAEHSGMPITFAHHMDGTTEVVAGLSSLGKLISIIPADMCENIWPSIRAHMSTLTAGQ